MPDDDQPTSRPVQLADGLPREVLLDTVRRAREGAPGPLALVGHGSSGVAVLSLAVHQRRLGLELAEVTCVGAHGEDDPVSGRPLDVPPPAPPSAPSITIVASTDEVSRRWTAETAAAFRAAGWTVTAAR